MSHPRYEGQVLIKQTPVDRIVTFTTKVNFSSCSNHKIISRAAEPTFPLFSNFYGIEVGIESIPTSHIKKI